MLDQSPIYIYDTQCLFEPSEINECEKNPCGQHASCVNTPGSFVCFCDEPFQMIDGECTGLSIRLCVCVCVCVCV